MSLFRRHLRAIALLWLLGQAASVSAFVPGHCCISHDEERTAKEKQDACHDSEPAPAPRPGDACPMSHDSGEACTMHRAAGVGDQCAMTNACDGPGAQLLSMFAYLGTLERPIATDAALDTAFVAVPPAAPPLFRFISPDAPPPKA